MARDDSSGPLQGERFRPGRRWVLATGAVLLVIAVGWARQLLTSSSADAPRTGALEGAGGSMGVRMERTWPVMGTIARLSASAADSAIVRAALEAGRDAIDRVDSLMSTYRPTSEISALNAAAGSGSWVDLSPATGTVVEAALRFAGLSGGALDPTVGPLMHAWGFRGGAPTRPRGSVLDSARSLVGWSRVEVEPHTGGVRVRLPLPGMALDLGAIAKGYALDMAMEALRGAGAAAGVADLGGNVEVFGPPPEGRSAWVLGIRNPRGQGIIGTMTLAAGSVATSGDYEQGFVEDGVRYTHIMDPRTGVPVRGMAQVTVAARQGIDADALSTLLFVMGPGPGRDFLGRVFPRGGLTVVWVADPGGQALTSALVTTVVDSTTATVEMTLGSEDAGGGSTP